MNSPHPAPDQGGPPPADWLVRALPDGLWMFDDDGRTTYANDVLVTMLGLDPAAISSFSVFDALDEPGRADFAAHLADRAAGEDNGRDLECLLTRRDGTTLWALVSHVRVRDDDGRSRGWLYRVKDNTQQRLLHDELVRRQEQLAEAQAIAGVGSWERVATGPTSWSAEAYRLCKVDPDDFDPTAEAFFALLHPDDSERLLPLYVEMLAGGDTLDVECRLASTGGPETWLRIRGLVTRDADGTLLRTGGTLQDITVAKNNERGLEFLSAMGGAANEARSLGEVLVAANDYVRPFARWPAVLVGAPVDAAPGAEMFFVEMEWSAASDETRRFARDLALEALGSRGIVQRAAPNGGYLVAGAARVGPRLACVVVSSTEADEPAAHADVAFFEQTLAILAHVAEREWAAEELATARDEALSASRAKSEFLATMSHEIRTPLNGVIGLSELLRRTELTEHQQRLAEGVDQAGRTLLALVNDILDLSKIEAGRLDLEEVDFDPRTIVEQSAGLVADKAREKGLELVVSSAADMPSLVRGDPVRFGQVITNLAANAVKFTASGEVVIRAEGLGSRVRVSVRDTGVGIAPEVQDGLFEAFTQADSSTTREYGGTGLGLAISTRIVTAMRGEIGVQSAVGLGSTFWFTVEFGAALGEHQSQRDVLRENAIAGLRVLVVDDNATNRFILTEQLTGWAIDVTAVESAYEALVELDTSVRRKTPYDVVLLDYMMPGADGEQLARIVRAEPRHDATRLVLLSSSTEPAGDWLVDAGIDRYLGKPVLPSRLLDTLAILGGRWEAVEDQAVVAAALVPVAGRGRILVVEDNAINQMVAEGVLRRLGFTVQIADNGAAGVAAVADTPEGFDAILMDCQMPVMDGFDATRAVRAIQRGGARTPIIAMTAAAVAEERERCLDAGMDDFLSKPVDVRLLAEMLDRWAPAAGGEPDAGAVAVVPSGPPESPSTARLAQLIDVEGIDLALVARMVERFEATATDALAALTRAAASGSAPGTELHAHALRGTAANLGLATVAQICARIEQLGREGRLPSDADLSALGGAVERGARELSTFVAARTAAG